jgi:hypothetical protein
MGSGEDYWFKWQDWFLGQSQETRRAIIARFPEPHGWQGFYPRTEQHFLELSL